MIRNIRDFVWASTVVAMAGMALALPETAHAQGGDGFLFKTPSVSIKFETGYGFQRASSEIFDFTRDQLTVGRRDFDSPYVGGEIAFRAADRWDLFLSVGHQSSSVASEFRDWVDADDLPIEQVTELRLIPAVMGAKYYLKERGRAVGQFAWIPTTMAPFVGGGVGVMSYRFEQTGDFIDFETLDVFPDRFTSEGTTFLARASAGVDISLGKQFLFTAEGRYGWASGDLGLDFSGFDAMDLDGFQLVGGLAVRF